MQDNFKNIDKFLFESLSDFEQLPDHGIGESILKQAQSGNEMDAYLNYGLENMEAMPDASFFNKIQSQIHPIDAAINQLKNLETVPETKAFIHQFKTSYYKKWAALLLLLITSVSVALFINKKTDLKSNKSLENNIITSNNKASVSKNELNNSMNETNTGTGLSNLTKENNEKENLAFIQKKTETKQGFIFKGEKTSTPSLSNTEDLFENNSLVLNLPLKLYHPFKNNFVKDNDLVALSPTKKTFVKPRLSKFSFELMTGFAFEKNRLNTIQSTFPYSDEGILFKKTEGKMKKGISTQFNISYQIRSGLKIKAGLQWTETNSSSKFEFNNRQVIVYDSLGNRLGYLQVPVNQGKLSTNQFAAKSRTIQIPVGLQGKVFSSNKLSIWSGVSAVFIYFKTTETKLFDFENNRLNNIKTERNFKLMPQANLFFNYQINAQFGINSLWQISMDKNAINNNNSKLNNSNFMSQINIGISYTPLIKPRQ